MECLSCGGGEFEIRDVEGSPEVKGEVVTVCVPAEVCTECGVYVMDSAQMDGLRRAAADGYRQRHGLLTSGQIMQCRAGLGMTREAFAKYVGVDEASLQKWETYYVQDKRRDAQIRRKCD